MEWSDEGIVLSVRPHGETAAVAELFTRSHGRHMGLVYGGRSRQKRPLLQPGNHLAAAWRGRLTEQLGTFSVDLKGPFAARLFDNRFGLTGLECLTSLARLLPERDPHPNLFEITLFVLGYLDDGDIWPALYARWELALLEELGFGLDLSACAVTGTRDDLAYVSPRTGRAVSAPAAEPYKTKLLRLPSLLAGGGAKGATRQDVRDALQLTGTFLLRDVLVPRGLGLPDARQRLLAL
jgi:DNA repair protein RecO (recombination protein O)